MLLIPGILASSTVSEFDPTSIANCKLWLDAADTASISVTGSDVTQWNDKSGNNYHFVQSVSVNRPKSGTRTINSKNVIDFDGTNDRLESNQAASVWKFLHDTSGSTIFLVGFSDTYSGYQAYLATAESSGYIGTVLYHSSTGYPVAYIARGVGGAVTAVDTSSTLLTAGTSYYQTFKLDPNNATAANRIKFRTNGANENGDNSTTNAPSTSNPSFTLSLGAAFDAVNYVGFYNGVLAEVIMYSGVLSGTDITTVEDYLATKWGL